MKFIFLILFSLFLTPPKYFIRLYKSQSNFAYVGIENPFRFETSEKIKYPLILKTNNGRISIDKKDTSLIIFNQPTSISVFKIVGQDTILLYDQKITPKLIPDPTVAINQIKIGGTMNSKLFFNATSLDGYLSNDIIGSENFFQVKSFLVVINGKSFRNVGKTFSNEIKTLFKTIKTGDKLIFDKVLAQGPDGVDRYISGPITVTIK